MVAIEPARLVKNALVVYGIPIVTFIVGAVAGAHVGRLSSDPNGTDVGAMVGAAIFLGLALIVTHLLDKAAVGRVEGLPRIIEILEEEN